jgi:two-component system response regulator YesN
MERMYTSVVIDDEPIVLEGIARSFRWEAHGFAPPMLFRNPREALEYILANRPDFVLTDIRMPGLDGIELIRTARAAGVRTEFAIVSGYSDFEYARAAVRYGVIEYLLKPLESVAADELLLRVVNILGGRASEKGVILLDKLRNGEIGLQELVPEAKEGFRILAGRCRPSLEKSSEPVRSGLELFEATCSDGLLLRIPESRSHWIWVCQRSFPDLPKVIPGDCMFGLSLPFTDEGRFNHALQQAWTALGNLQFLERKGIRTYSSSSPSVAAKLAGRWLEAVRGHSIAGKKEGLDELAGFLSESANPMEDALLVHLLAVRPLEEPCGDDARGSASSSLIDVNFLLSEHGTLVRYLSYLEDLGTADIPIDSPMLQSYNRKLEEIEQYIRVHYNERIYLKDLSTRYFLNMNYLCQVFKKYHGCSFTDYVTRLRMEKAVELLEHTEESLERIGEIVGYQDYYYFIRVFKNQYGIPPAKYRFAKRHGTGAS